MNSNRFYIYSSVLLSLLLCFTSCDNKKKEIMFFSQQVVDKLNKGDVNGIKELYPNSINIDSFTKGYSRDSILISEDPMTNGYKISLREDVWFILTEPSPSKYLIVKSKGLFIHDDRRLGLAKRSGRITPNMTDDVIEKELEDSNYYEFLAKKANEKMQKYIYCTSSIDPYARIDDWLKFGVRIVVHNNTNRELQKSDYKIKAYTLWMGKPDEVLILGGQHVPSNDSISIPVVFNYNGSGGSGFDAELLFETFRLSTMEILDRYYEPNMNDYKEYQNSQSL